MRCSGHNTHLAETSQFLYYSLPIVVGHHVHDSSILFHFPSITFFGVLDDHLTCTSSAPFISIYFHDASHHLENSPSPLFVLNDSNTQPTTSPIHRTLSSIRSSFLQFLSRSQTFSQFCYVRVRRPLYLGLHVETGIIHLRRFFNLTLL